MQIHLAIHEILANKDLIVTNDLISQLFVITFVSDIKAVNFIYLPFFSIFIFILIYSPIFRT